MSYDPSCEIFRINKQLCSFSSDGRFLALANQSSLIIKNTGTFDNYRTFVFPDCIEEFNWSPDSEYILCYSTKKGIIQVYSINHPEWKFKLIEGSAGLDSVIWAPDSQHIISIADLKVQLSIWSLIDNSVIYIRNLKSNAAKEIKFSPNKKYFAVIVSENGKDSIDLYKTKDWKLSKKLICEGLYSIDGVCWSPNSEILSVWCAVSGVAKMIIYSTVTECYEGIFHPDDSKFITKYKNDNLSNEFDEKLHGLEIVKWSPSGQLLALSGHNETIVLLNCLTWNPLLQLRLEPVVKGDNYLIRVFKECAIKESKDCNKTTTDKSSTSSEKHILEEVGSRPVNIPIVKCETFIGGNPATVTMRIIDIMEFSTCGQYLAIRHQIYPGTLWIWDIRTNGIDILILQNSISAIKWDPIYPRVLIFTESTHMFEWNPDEVACLNTPRGITVLDARWHPSSDLVTLCGYNRAIVYRFNNKKNFSNSQLI